MNAPATGGSLGRRGFLKLAALGGGGLVLGFYLRGANRLSGAAIAKPAEGASFRPSVFIRIGTDGAVTLVSKQPEIGQGIKTSLPMIIAEELEVDWKDVTVVQGDLDPAYGNQGAGGSRSTPNNYDEFHLLGATARTMLVGAAAQIWGAPPAECFASGGAVQHRPSGRVLKYGDLVTLAATLPVPEASAVSLKAPADYRLLGTRIPGVDNKRVVSGKPLFGIDTRLPGMLYAVYVKCPVFGGRVLSANLDQVKALPGVRDAFLVEGTANLLGLRPGVAIVADSTWAAFSARKQLTVTWDEGRFAGDSWEAFSAKAAEISGRPGASTLHKSGDFAAAFGGAAKTLEASYSYPFISHASMEPQNCTALYRDGGFEFWAPSQNPGGGQDEVSRLFKIPKERITVHLTRSGGGFGRRLSHDFFLEAAAVAQRVAGPVKLTWSREDDMGHDHFRPGGFHFLKGGLDASGTLVAWHSHFATFGTMSQGRDGIALRPGSGGGMDADQFPAHFVANCLTEQTIMECAIPMGPWRAPGNNVYSWVIQSFIDELAFAAGRDPVEFRLDLLSRKMGGPYNAPRMTAVVKHAAEKAGWDPKRFPKGRGQGIAFHWSHQGYVAHVAEVTVSKDGQLKVDRVVSVCDVGMQIVNRSGAENQVEGSVVDGLGTLMYPELTLEHGHFTQSNFNEYQLIRMPDAPPKIEVHFLKSEYATTGLGEPAIPPVAPAVCNAIFAATGKRVRQFPLAHTDLTWS